MNGGCRIREAAPGLLQSYLPLRTTLVAIRDADGRDEVRVRFNQAMPLARCGGWCWKRRCCRLHTPGFHHHGACQVPEVAFDFQGWTWTRGPAAEFWSCGCATGGLDGLFLAGGAAGYARLKMADPAAFREALAMPP